MLTFLVETDVKWSSVWKQSAFLQKFSLTCLGFFSLRSPLRSWSPGLHLTVAAVAFPCRGDLDGFPCEPVQGSADSFASLLLPHLLVTADLDEVWRPWWKIVARLISPELLEARLPRKQIRCVVITIQQDVLHLRLACLRDGIFVLRRLSLFLSLQLWSEI